MLPKHLINNATHSMVTGYRGIELFAIKYTEGGT